MPMDVKCIFWIVPRNLQIKITLQISYPQELLPILIHSISHLSGFGCAFMEKTFFQPLSKYLVMIPVLEGVDEDQKTFDFETFLNVHNYSSLHQ